MQSVGKLGINMTYNTVDHVTFLGDWKIIFQTVLNVIKRDGINSETGATMEVFMGTEERVEENV